MNYEVIKEKLDTAFEGYTVDLNMNYEPDTYILRVILKPAPVVVEEPTTTANDEAEATEA